MDLEPVGPWSENPSTLKISSPSQGTPTRGPTFLHSQLAKSHPASRLNQRAQGSRLPTRAGCVTRHVPFLALPSLFSSLSQMGIRTPLPNGNQNPRQCMAVCVSDQTTACKIRAGPAVVVVLLLDMNRRGASGWACGRRPQQGDPVHLTWCKWFTHLVALGVKIDQLGHSSIVGPLEIGLGI